jgi:hypothetical protein
MHWRDGTVDQHKVARVDTGFAHRVPGHAHQERGLRVLDEDVVEVEPCDAGVVRRRPEADGHAGAGGHRVGRRVAADLDGISDRRRTTGHSSSIAEQVLSDLQKRQLPARHFTERVRHWSA